VDDVVKYGILESYTAKCTSFMVAIDILIQLLRLDGVVSVRRIVRWDVQQHETLSGGGGSGGGRGGRESDDEDDEDTVSSTSSSWDGSS
jgi:hypothetical protein